jgi:hypothetical protein
MWCMIDCMLRMDATSGAEIPTVRSRIRLRLDELDRTPVWLSKVLEVDLSLVSRWLSGDKPIPDDRLRQIAIALHRPVKWFRPADEEDEPAA